MSQVTLPTVLVVDDDPSNRLWVERILSAEGLTIRTASDGAEALAVVASEPPDIVLLDVVMPGVSGIDVCRRLKQDPATRLTPVVLVTGLIGRDERIAGIDAGADDFLTKPVDAHELRARVRSLLRLKQYTDELDSAETIILSLALTIEARDSYTRGHCQRLAQYATTLGVRLGLPEEDLAALYRGGYLHDIGKIATPDAILLKPGPLTPEERRLVEQHTVVGDRLCGHLRSLRKVRPIVRHHHEFLDGSGYPDGLAGDAVPLLAQIIGIVDAYDAMITDRPYKPAKRPPAAHEELLLEARRGLRALDLVREFIGICERGELEAALPARARPFAHDIRVEPAETEQPARHTPHRGG